MLEILHISECGSESNLTSSGQKQNMPRREDLSDFEEDEDDEAIIDKTKKKKNTEKKTYVFEIKLSENMNE